MKTEILQVDSATPNPAIISRAAEALANGGLVAFPTETVYGLGANAFDPRAVLRIFEAKGRPARNPLIVHVFSIDRARQLVSSWPREAALLAEKFWPGPLTLVLPKTKAIPDEVTAGGPTVALRFPAHPVARALLEAAKVPLAAPSANLSTEISPTTAQHVLRSLDGRVDLILDGGPCPGGVESTVLDLTESRARILRPGGITPKQIEDVIGEISRASGLPHGQPTAKLPVARSPGLMERHYAPRVSLEWAQDSGRTRVDEILASGVRAGWLTFEAPHGSPNCVSIQMPVEARAFQAKLYAALHELEDANVSRIVVAALPENDEWLAARDRLTRASFQKESKNG